MAIRIILAGGGTAGHVEPALAVADAIRQLRSDATCIFLGTETGLESRLVPARGFELRTISKVSMPRSLNVQSISFPFRLVNSVQEAKSALAGADLVIGFGGYVSASAYLAARLLKIPIAIHEANAKPGWANRLGRYFATVVAVNFASVQKSWDGSIVTGMPIRDSIAELARSTSSERAQMRKRALAEWGFSDEKPVIAIFGGSQGSRHINTVIADFLKSPSANDFQIIHSVGLANELPVARSGYLPLPYFDNMAQIYGAADLLITRSGAVTCSEISVVGRYAILVPLPHGNGEQISNAQALVDQGRATAVADRDFTAQWLNVNLGRALIAARAVQGRDDSSDGDAARRIATLALSSVNL